MVEIYLGRLINVIKLADFQVTSFLGVLIQPVPFLYITE